MADQAVAAELKQGHRPDPNIRVDFLCKVCGRPVVWLQEPDGEWVHADELREATDLADAADA